VHSFELFADPDGVADRVQNILSPAVVERVEELVTATMSIPVSAPMPAPVFAPVPIPSATRPPAPVDGSDVATAPLEIRSYRDEED
jgi:hypothetical protein